jgi:RNA-directed DNA polymerase
MWFGRRDTIPPVSDPWTKLIDRGMLTQGLLSAEELAEMHRVGDEWSKHANRLEHIQIQAAQSAEEAVEADRAAQAALKERKKAEAAERKKRHAEAVARRKATDIVFVGKGVSAFLGARASDADRLAAAGLPVLHTPADLAGALGLTIPKLRWLCFHTEVATRIHYVQFDVPKKSGGTRTLSAPHRTLAAGSGTPGRWPPCWPCSAPSARGSASSTPARRTSWPPARGGCRRGRVPARPCRTRSRESSTAASPGWRGSSG